VAPSKKKDEPEINVLEIAELLRDYFPIFNFGNELKKFFIGRRRYFIKEQGKWTINVAEMSKIKDKFISALFPSRNPSWNEAEARSRYNEPDVIRFFIDEINAYYYSEFSKVKQNASVHINENAVTAMFLKEIKYELYKKNKRNIYRDQWDFSEIVVHLLRHKKPPSIYEAFDSYAHKQYTKLYFASDELINKHAPDNCEIGYLLENGFQAAIEALVNEYPEVRTVRDNCPPNPKTERQRTKYSYYRKFLKLINEEFESVPQDTNKKKGNKYAPIKFDTFIVKFKHRLPHIKKIFSKDDYDKNDEKYDPFTKGDKRTINNHIAKIKKHVNDPQYLVALNELPVKGGFRYKIHLLYQLSLEQSVIKVYSARGKLKKIQELYDKQNPTVSFVEEMGGKYGHETYNRHDKINEEDTENNTEGVYDV
jgi:hypothetical protein